MSVSCSISIARFKKKLRLFTFENKSEVCFAYVLFLSQYLQRDDDVIVGLLATLWTANSDDPYWGVGNTVSC